MSVFTKFSEVFRARFICPGTIKYTCRCGLTATVTGDVAYCERMFRRIRNLHRPNCQAREEAASQS